MAPVANCVQIDDILRPLLLKDLRIQCRARDLNPAGGRDALLERLRQHMLDSGDMSLATEDGPCTVSASTSQFTSAAPAMRQPFGESSNASTNNYIRPEGQNVGNTKFPRPRPSRGWKLDKLGVMPINLLKVEAA